MTQELRVAMIGTAFMGRSHSHAWRNVAAFYDVPLKPVLQVVCGRNPEGTQTAAERMGWNEASTDWRSVIARDDVDLVDVCTPGSSHAEITLAALAAGKHVLCEKPLANTVAEAQAMADAAAKAATEGVRTMCGFNYRRVPAIGLARQLVADGRIGEVRQVRAVYLQDWIVDPEFPMVWRLDAGEAGSGSLGDIGSHIIDLTQHLLDAKITEVAGLTETFIPERKNAEGGTSKVTVDDAAVMLARYENGAIGTLEATRFATGRKNGLRVELNGSLGSIAFDLERLNELELYESSEGSTAGFRRVLVTESDHPWVGAWWPPGHIVGWEHTFTHQVRDLLVDLDQGRDPSPSFAEALQVQKVLDAVQRSASERGWSTV